MLKKLQNLLFEDDDDDYLDDEDEEETVSAAPVKPSAVKPVAAQPRRVDSGKPVQERREAPSVQPAVEQPVHTAPRVSRIDVTQDIPVQNSKPAQPVFPQMPPREEKKPSGLGITADDTDYHQPVRQRTVKPAVPKTQKPKKPSKPAYQFQPVISPIFGVDEKDMTALKNTAKKAAEAMAENDEDDGNITPVISPIYGSAEPLAAKKAETHAKAAPARKEEPVATANPTADEEIPDFSLDDILKVRDEQYDDHDDSLSDTAPLFPDLNFPDDPVSDAKPAKPEEEPDQTMILKKPLTK